MIKVLCLFGLHHWEMRLFRETGAYRDDDIWRKGPADQPLYVVRCRWCEGRYP